MKTGIQTWDNFLMGMQPPPCLGLQSAPDSILFADLDDVPSASANTTVINLLDMRHSSHAQRLFMHLVCAPPPTSCLQSIFVRGLRHIALCQSPTEIAAEFTTLNVCSAKKPHKS
jgi:hypothetical protein